MGTNCAPLIADLFLYCYERAFLSDLQKAQRFDLIDMFNDTSRYLDDIFNIDNPEFEKHISDIYPAELLLNKANTLNKETSFLDLNIKIIGSDIHTSVYDKRDDFGFRRALSKPPQRRQGPDLRPLWLLVGTPSAIRPELAFSRAEHSLPYSDVTIYIFAILYLSSMPYV